MTFNSNGMRPHRRMSPATVRRTLAAATGAGMLLAAVSTAAFTLPERIQRQDGSFNFGYRWDATNALISFSIPAADGNNYNRAFDQAVARWNAVSDFELSTVAVARSPCAVDDNNGAAFRGSNCADVTFGDQVLAITLLVVQEDEVVSPPVAGVRGPVFQLLETDIVFNGNKEWSVYSGDIRDAEDFRRVAVHELGHVMGIDHVPSDGPPAIMREQISRTEYPQSDDIKGVNARYPSLPNGVATVCRQSVAIATGGNIAGTVLGTCTEADLLSTGGSQGPANRYRLTVASSGTYTIRSVGRDGFSTRLKLLNSSGNSVIASAPAGASPRITRSLPAGNYTVVVSGEEPGVDGSFTLSALVGSGSAVSAIVPVLNLLLDDD